mgnify:CR=1 FL=1
MIPRRAGQRIAAGLTAALLACSFGLWTEQPAFGEGSSASGAAGDAPAGKKVSPDAWLAKACLAELDRCVETGQFKALEDRVREIIVDRAAWGKFTDLGVAVDLVYVQKAAKYINDYEQFGGGRELGKWLVENRDVARVLFRALGDAKSPLESMRSFKELLDAEEEAVKARPNLAAAFATSQPLRHYTDQPDPASMLESFRWYTSSGTDFRFDVKSMPYELARYLADTRLNLNERKWAVSNYTRHGNPARAYFDLRYDYDHYRQNKPKKIASLPYTLPNLRRVGWVCIEQAYYAAEICKALGVPAAIVSGRGKSGVRHAWVIALKPSGRGGIAVWDSRTGRYGSHQYFTGQVRNPATGERLLDSELMLLGHATQVPLERREGADAALAVAEMIEAARVKDEQRSMTALTEFAGAHKEAGASTEGLKANRKLDLTLTREMLDQSLECNLVHRPTWEFIVRLAREERMGVEDLEGYFDVLLKKTTDDYPDYGCDLLLQVVPTIEKERRIQVYANAMGIYARRRDLRGRLLLAAGEEYLAAGDKGKALKAFQESATQAFEVPDVMLDASRRAEDLLLEARRPDMAIKMYMALFQRAGRVRASERVLRSTARGELGERLIRLFREMGDTRSAERIKNMLEK